MISSPKDSNADIEYISTNYAKLSQELEKLGSSAVDHIKEKIYDKEILPNVYFRVKEMSSLIKKCLKSPTPRDRYNELSDKLGVRVICGFVDELKVVKDIIHENFEVIKFDAKGEELDKNKFGYLSDHYDVKAFAEWSNDSTKIFEIQVRTLCQHTWADSNHKLTYKKKNLTDKRERELFRLASLLEIADDGFNRLKKTLSSNDKVMNTLNQLEGKFYRYARMAFDYETSINNLEILLKMITFTKSELDLFLAEKDEKIKFIFDSKRDTLVQNIILSQPEIILVWFFLEKDEYTLRDLWVHHFPLENLSNIATYWGKSID